MIKIVKNNKIEFPEYGQQNFHFLTEKKDKIEHFKLLINRKGHLRRDNLTYQFTSVKSGNLIRLDMTGAPHDDRFGQEIQTPHVHIFDELHNNGRWAIPLVEISDDEIINELHDSLIIFLRYNNIERTDIKILLV